MVKTVALLQHADFFDRLELDIQPMLHRDIDRLLRTNRGISDDDVVMWVAKANLLQPMRIGVFRSFNLELKPIHWKLDDGNFNGYRAWANVEYSGSGILWKAKPPSLDWRFGGKINSASARIKVPVRTYDLTEAAATIREELDRARLAVPELDEQVSDFNDWAQPQMDRMIRFHLKHTDARFD